MNVSHEHRMVWWTKPNMGEKVIASSLKDHNFHNFVDRLETNSLSKHNFSLRNEIPENCQNYLLTISVRNPYFQIINYYLDVSVYNWKLKTVSMDNFKGKMNKWVKEIFSVQKEVLLDTNNLLQGILPYRNLPYTPHFVLKYENMFDDLSKLPFIDRENLFLNENLMVDNSRFEVNTLTFENAQLIYKIHKKTFEDFGYEPFSFTNQELTLKQKVDFMHT